MLYVVQQRDVNLGTVSRELEARGIHQWIYLGEDGVWRLGAESIISTVAGRLSIADPLDEMAWKLRQPYIDWIGELSLWNNSLEWWGSELASKNPYSRLYPRICLLGVGRQMIAEGFNCPALIVCSSPALYKEVVRFASEKEQSLQALIRNSGLRRLREESRRYLRGAYRRLRLLTRRVLGAGIDALESDPSYRRRLLVQNGVKATGDFSGEDTILLFTWVDRRNFTPDGQYQDPHLGPLAEMLRGQGYRVAYVPRVLASVPFGEMVDRLKQTGEQLFFPEHYVSDQERKDCFRRAWRFKPVIPSDLRICDIRVHGLAWENFYEKRRNLAEALIYERLVSNLSAAGVCPRQIIHTMEGQSWEQVLAWSVRRHMPNTKVVGYDNVNFTRMALSMFPARCEYGLRPLPDRIVTNGPLYGEVLVAENVPPSLVKVGCALRHSHLWNGEADPPHRDGNDDFGPIRVLVATSIASGDSVELVTKALKAFGKDPGYEVIVKFHPAVDQKVVMGYLDPAGGCGNVRFVTASIQELLPAVDVMLYTYSAVCYEALRYGVPPIFVKADSYFNLDQLDPARGLRWEATTPEDLRRVVQAITRMTADERRDWQRRASEVVRDALAPITPRSVDAFLI